MDTVILAAGKGERLGGIAAPYHKPLLVINGRPLVQQAVDLAVQNGAARVIVVVAPENAGPISHVLGDRKVFMVVQQKPHGPGHALRVGLEVARPGKVLVLMGDNVSTFADIEKVCDTGGQYGIGVQYVDRTEGARFTYWSERTQDWVEDGAPVLADTDGTGMLTAWVGPLMIDRDTARGFYAETGVTDIGPVLSRLIPTPAYVMQSVTTYDIGVPEMIT